MKSMNLDFTSEQGQANQPIFLRNLELIRNYCKESKIAFEDRYIWCLDHDIRDSLCYIELYGEEKVAQLVHRINDILSGDSFLRTLLSLPIPPYVIYSSMRRHKPYIIKDEYFEGMSICSVDPMTAHEVTELERASGSKIVAVLSIDCEPDLEDSGFFITDEGATRFAPGAYHVQAYKRAPTKAVKEFAAQTCVCKTDKFIYLPKQTVEIFEYGGLFTTRY